MDEWTKKGKEKCNKPGKNIQSTGSVEDTKDEKTKTTGGKPHAVWKSDPKKPTICPKLFPKIKKTVTGQTLIPLEDVLRDRWLVKGLIGHGGYGEIYYAVDIRSAEEVAIKVEPKKRKGLMQLLSVNVGDLKKASPVKRLGRSSVGRIMQQAIAALRDVHLGGYIHRDVKPANMCFGITTQTRHILVIVDFGLVRRFKNLDGTTRPLRPRAGFRGTVRYVSIRVHERIDQGPADDLVSLVYSGLELLVGDLPWKYIVKGDDVKQAKLELEMVGDRKMSDPYDWEMNYREAIEGVRVYPFGFEQKCKPRHRCAAMIEEAA
ncbi:hypothetical protein TELCIR_04835 [Teladorsagia circumcincta]|uniref:non-specific serine/threonine protein kinase n=1 Tax=Teladorsagia circumcincta TaxID=45464 RepID=A0A2G9UTY3_TELCI|nr:hypothetical protein TELCIR_04835 [Teladorsagia circumcincta]